MTENRWRQWTLWSFSIYLHGRQLLPNCWRRIDN